MKNLKAWKNSLDWETVSWWTLALISLVLAVRVIWL